MCTCKLNYTELTFQGNNFYLSHNIFILVKKQMCLWKTDAPTIKSKSSKICESYTWTLHVKFQ